MASNNGYHPELEVDHITPENLGQVQSLLATESAALKAQGLTHREAYQVAGVSVAEALGIDPDSFWQELGRALADIRRAKRGLPVLLPGAEMFEEITPAPKRKRRQSLGQVQSPVAKVVKVAPQVPASPIAKVEKVQTEPVYTPVLGAVIGALEKANLKKPGQGIKVTFVTVGQALNARKSSNLASQRLGYTVKAQRSQADPLTVTFIRK